MSSPNGNISSFRIKEEEEEKRVKISFHDTAGQERYRSIAFNLIKSANGVILTYDITNRETFNAIPMWIQSIREQKEMIFPLS